MKTLNIDGVDCFVFLEAMKPTKGMIVTVIAPVDASVPLADRKYVSYRNGFIPLSEISRADKLASRRDAQNYFERLTADDVRQFLADARAQALEQI